MEKLDELLARSAHRAATSIRTGSTHCRICPETLPQDNIKKEPNENRFELSRILT